MDERGEKIWCGEYIRRKKIKRRCVSIEERNTNLKVARKLIEAATEVVDVRSRLCDCG